MYRRPVSGRRHRRRPVAPLAVLAALTAAVLLPLPQTAATAASPTTATLTVQKGGDRTGSQSIAGLAGATFDFYAGVSGTRPGPGDTPDATCVTDSDGRCSVDVPGRTGNNQGYWIIERSAPTGWTVIQSLDTGGSTTTPTVYNGVFTGNVANNQSYTFPVDTTGNTNRTARGNHWADIRDNPDLPQQCGLNIALLIDVSGSIAPDLPTVKSAANGFVDALTGTPSQISLFSFASLGQAVLGPTSVSSTEGADLVKSHIDALTAGGGTNWDDGLWQVAAVPTVYDAVIMLTDGNPTLYGPTPSGPGNFTRFKEVENGVFSANAIKAKGTKIVAVGVGAGVTGSELNLQAVSGPVRGVDFIQTGYAELAEVFRRLALAACAGTVSVVKEVFPAGGDPATAVPAGGWTFQTPTEGVTPASGETDTDTGALSFDVDLQDQPSRPVTVTEVKQPGYTLYQQDGYNAACTANGQPVTVTNVDPLSFSVDALADAIVTCTVLNEEPPVAASVLVNKHWLINGVPYDEPEQPAAFEASLQLTNEPAPVWGQVYTGFTVGDTAVVGETINEDLLPPGCTVDATGDLGPHVLSAGLNTFSVLNTVQCTSTLSLFKTVVNPYGAPEPPQSWTLTAYRPVTGVPVFSGTTGVHADVDAGVRYSLGESTVPGYTQYTEPNAVIVPPATGSWQCRLRLRDGTLSDEDIGGANGTIAVQLGQRVECTATNNAQAGKLTLRKVVSNTHGGNASPQDWTLSAIPSDGDGATPVVGHDGDPSVTGATVIPGVGYTLSESGPGGYTQQGSVSCVLTGTDTPVETPQDVLTPQLGQDITCTFTNADVAPRLTLVKSVNGGSAQPGDWTLSATPPGGGTPISGPSGSAAVTDAEATAGVAYTLSEAGGPSGYREGEPSCVLTGSDTPVPTPGRVLTLSLGQNVTCTFVNTAEQAWLTLVKIVKCDGGHDGHDGDHHWPDGGDHHSGRGGDAGPDGDQNGDGWHDGGHDGDGWHDGHDGGHCRPADPTDWILTATPLGGGTVVSGRSGSPQVTHVPVTVGTGYRLTESHGPRGYREIGPPTCVLTGTRTPVPVVNRVVTPGAGQDITCTFRNRKGGYLPITGDDLLRTGETGTAVLLGGVALLGLGHLLNRRGGVSVRTGLLRPSVLRRRRWGLVTG